MSDIVTIVEPQITVVAIAHPGLTGAPGASGSETASTLGALIGGAGDATPNNTDYVATALTAGGILQKITWTNVKAFLKTYFDGLYPAGSGTSTGTNTGDNASNTQYSGLVTNATHTGDVIGAASLTVAANAVTNAKAAQMATKTYKGRTTAATGDSEDIPVATLKADLVLIKADVGLGNVDNTSDVNKPVSTAQAAGDTAATNAAKAYADALVVGLVDDRGNYNASVNAYPSSGGSGTAGAILKGDLWTVSVAGTLPTGVVVTAGDLVRALVDTPGATQSNWAVTENNIGYVAENAANKNVSGGYAGLTLFKLNLRNVADTITNWFTTAATVARTWTMPDKDGTVAMTSDITGTNSGTNTGDQTSIVGITGTKAQFNTAVTDGDIVYLDSVDTITGVKTFNDGKLSVKGATSGNVLIKAPAVAGTDTVAVMPILLDKKAIPIGIPHSGTMGANGAVTFGSAFDRTYSDGVWFNMAAGAVFAGSLATVFYYCVMSSTTVGVFYTNTYTPGTNQPDIPASPTAVSDAGPGAFVGVTVEVTAASTTIPAGLLGKDGVCRRTLTVSCINSGNNKTVRTKLDATTLGVVFNVVAGRTVGFINSFANAGVQNRQIAIPAINDTSSGTALVGTNAQTSIDTSASTTHTITLQHSVAATDWIVLDRYMIEVFAT